MRILHWQGGPGPAWSELDNDAYLAARMERFGEFWQYAGYRTIENSPGQHGCWPFKHEALCKKRVNFIQGINNRETEF